MMDVTKKKLRRIKFRGMYPYSGTWVYGDLVHVNAGQDKDGKDIFGMIIVPDGGLPYKELSDNLVQYHTVGQFTGLIDANGKEIYEGDIIRSYGSKGDEIIHIIEYYDEEACFIARLNGYSKYDFGCGTLRQKWINEFHKEVIGNIYDNPGLVKDYDPEP